MITEFNADFSALDDAPPLDASLPFLWGVATAACQIEGARHLRGDSVWDMLAEQPGRIFSGHTPDLACDHYHHLDEDVGLLGELGVNAYRFSVSWPRILPAGVGKASSQGLGFYDRLVDKLCAADITPVLTLFHWDFPYELFLRGGWLNRESADWFAGYVDVVTRHLSDRVRFWITHNEPQMFLALGHVAGTHAPGLKLGDREMLLATHHAFLAHGRAVQVLRAAAKQPPKIGIAPAGFVKMPSEETPEAIDLARRAMFAVVDTGHFNNAWYMDPMLLGQYPEDGLRLFSKLMPKGAEADLKEICQPLDFLGANIYGGVRVRPGHSHLFEEIPQDPGHPATLMGWPVEPDSLRWGPRFLTERYALPILITENGMSGHDWVHADGTVPDPARIDFLQKYLASLSRGISEGADVRGFFIWSLLDNFEWAEGYKHRFGLVHVDYATLKRTPKASFHFYKHFIACRQQEHTT